MNNYGTLQKDNKNWSLFLGEGHTLLHSNAWPGTQYVDQDGLELAWFSLFQWEDKHEPSFQALSYYF